jgi:carboxyl-terminal processing protease
MTRIPSRARQFVLIPAFILLCALLGGIYGPKVTAQSDSSSTEVQNSLQSISKVLHAVEENYSEPVDPEKVLYQGAIPGMLRTLDPHSNFFDPKSFSALREEQRGRYYGVGMTVTPRNGKTIVLAPFVGSPAYKAGLRPGDVIVQVNDKVTDNLSTTEVADMLKGPKGTAVRITVSREGSPEPLQFSIIRDEIPRASIEHAFLIQPGVGYIRIASFNETTSQELRDKLRELNPASLKGLILDLRNNPGGLLAEGVNVTDMFLQKGQLIVSHRGRASREKRYVATHGNRGYDFPLVVLINRFTASAAEIVSGAIQDHDRGLIVGESSFGKGLVQTVYPLSENSGLALTTAKYYTPSGRLIQRDYYNVSIYDYYTRKEGAAPIQSEVKSTDAGRTVYGGGGITPDFEALEPKFNKFQENLARKYAFFNFSKRYLAENNGTVAQSFEVTDAVLARFKKFLKEQDVTYEETDFAANLDYVRQQIKLELFLSVFGMDEAYKLEAAADAQILKGIQLLPQAAALEQNARQVIATRDPR